MKRKEVLNVCGLITVLVGLLAVWLSGGTEQIRLFHGGGTSYNQLSNEFFSGGSVLVLVGAVLFYLTPKPGSRS